jgi:hypothetical protein
MNLREIGCEGVNWLELIQLEAFVNAVMNLEIPLKVFISIVIIMFCGDESRSLCFVVNNS